MDPEVSKIPRYASVPKVSVASVDLEAPRVSVVSVDPKVSKGTWVSLDSVASVGPHRPLGIQGHPGVRGVPGRGKAAGATGRSCGILG